MRTSPPTVVNLRERQAEVEDAIFARVRDAVPDPIGLADAEYVAGLRATVGAVVEYGLHGIERGEEGCEPIPSVAIAQAHRAARTGVSLETVLLRYTAGYTLLGDFVVEEIERSQRLRERGALRHLLKVQAALLERLTSAIAGEYRYELERTQCSAEQRQLQLVQRLLAGAPVDTAGFDYNFEIWHMAVIATGSGAAQALRSLQAWLHSALLSVAYSEQTVWGWLGRSYPVEAAELARVACGDRHAGANGRNGSARPGVSPAVALAIGEPGHGLKGWRVSHNQAQAARVVALRAPQTLTRYADVALLAAALKDETLAAALIDRFLAPLDGYQGSDTLLRETLRAYFAAECNVSSAAHALKVVRHTVTNRLETIEARLGRPLQPRPAELDVALRLDELGAAVERKIPVSG